MSWKALLGHEPQIELFRRIVAGGRLAHGYLFLGPEGIGKRRFAQELAKALNCENSASAGRLEACDECSSCGQIDSGNHPDVETLALAEGQHEFPIEEIRGLIGRINLKPAKARRRAIILDDAGAMSEAAANAFLKTLEEPPPHSLLMLLGAQADHFKQTILSRCQLVRFRPLAEKVIAALLLEQGLAKSQEEADAIAAQSEGSLGMARLLSEPSVREFRRGWLRGFADARLDPVALAEKLTKFVEEAGTESAAKRERAQLVLRFLVDVLSQALGLASGRAIENPEPTAVYLAERLKQRKLLELADRVLEAEQQVNRYLQLVLVLEALTDALSRPLLAR